MSIARPLSGLALLGAVCVAAWDGYRSSSGSGLLVTSIRELWLWAHLPDPLPFLNEPSPLGNWLGVARGLFEAPASPLLGLLGVVLYLAARRAPPAAVGKTEGEEQELTAEKQTHAPAASELRQALTSCRTALLGTAVFSGIINVLMLTGSIFMLEIYDRVLPSRSVPTLVGLCIIAGILFAALGLLDLIRSRLLVRVGRAIDEALASRVFDALVRMPVRTGSRGDGLQPLRDLDAVRSFLSGPGPTALFDMPWLPFYLGITFAFHFLLGVTALIGAIVLVTLTVLTEILVRRPMRESTAQGISRFGLAETCLRNAEVLAGMGFASRLGKMWHGANTGALSLQQRASDVGSGLGAIARVLRMTLQSAVLAVGAYLVIYQEASAGIIIAGAILAARALAPVDLAIAHWRGFIAARQSWQRLKQLLAMLPAEPTPMPLPPPSARLQVEGVIVVPPGGQKLVLREVNFGLNRGQGLGIIGPSGSGKTSLARVLVGAWRPARGSVRLDGAALEQWSPEALGHHIGYLPQDVQLFSGSVAQNIARFDPRMDPEAVIKAAKQADVHDLIVNLPKGYDTEIGDGGTVLSAGQRQRVALARALYGDPFLVVLDEPDASLDVAGEQALRQSIAGVRARGGIAIVVSHRQAVLGAVDLLLALQAGQALAMGPKEMVLQKLMRPASGTVQSLKSPADVGRLKVHERP